MTKDDPPLKDRIDALDLDRVLPGQRGLFYGGAWHRTSEQAESISPGNGKSLGPFSIAQKADIDRAMESAAAGFRTWRDTKPAERGRVLRAAAARLRENAVELAMIDALDCGNPVREMVRDVEIAASGLEYFGGLAQETKGDTVPIGPDDLNFTLREPLGVCVRIVPFNHPFMFAAMKAAAPLAAGNVIVIKPPHQAPLSTLRLAELWADIIPPGVFNVLTGFGETGQALVTHPTTARVDLIGSVPTGRAVMRSAAERITPVGLELGGKNALIAWPDSAPDDVASAAVAGMNFTWCGQSCGSTSRAFLHEDIYDETLALIAERASAIRPGLPSRYDTDMGAIASRDHYDRILGFINGARNDGVRLVAGGGRPDDPELADGFYILPTVFADVTPDMAVAREEIFGPVLAVSRWSDPDAMFDAVNGVDYGLTASLWTKDLDAAMRACRRVDAGYVWVNNTSQHFLGMPFGGFKQSGIGKEESLDELLSFTRLKSVNIRLG